MNKIYKFYVDYGRMGSLEGIFVADEKDVAKIMGKEIYFGEVLGKHSECSAEINEDTLTVLSEDPDFVEKFISIMGYGTTSGLNPLEYYYEDEEEQDEGDFDEEHPQ